MDHTEFVKRLYILDKAMPSQAKALTKERIEIYWECLKDIPDADLDRAMKRALTELKFFPTVAELRDLAGVNRDADAVAEDAWAMLNQALSEISWTDSLRLPGPLAEAVRRLGGLKRVWWRRAALDDNDWEPWAHKEFLAVWASTVGREWPEYLAGQLELDSMENERAALAAGMPERAVKYKFKVVDLTKPTPALPEKGGEASARERGRNELP